MNKIGKRSFYKALDNLSGYCMGFQAIFALAVGIFFFIMTYSLFLKGSFDGIRCIRVKLRDREEFCDS